MKKPFRFSLPRLSPAWKAVVDTVFSLAVLGIATGLGFYLMDLKLDAYNCLLVYLIGIIVISTVTDSAWFSLVSGLIAILLHNVLFIEPRGSFVIQDYRYLVSLIFMVIAVLAINFLAFYIKRKQREASKAKEEALSAQTKAEAEHYKAILLRSISHDLRTPLTSLKVASALAMEPGVDPKRQKELLSIVNRKADWIDRVLENLLLLTKIESLDVESFPKEPIPIEDMIGQGKEAVESEIGNRKILVFPKVTGDLAYGDFTLLSLLIQNLLSNAIKFTDSQTGIIRIAFRSDGDRIRFKVSNNGPKIPESDLSHVFELFYSRSKQGDTGLASDGTGMGLTICEAIVKLHGGTIAVENEPEGPAFEFDLPKWMEKPGEPSAK